MVELMTGSPAFSYKLKQKLKKCGCISRQWSWVQSNNLSLEILWEFNFSFQCQSLFSDASTVPFPITYYRKDGIQTHATKNAPGWKKK